VSADEDQLRALEESLWRPKTRFDRAHMESVLAERFIEFGRSGRIYDRDTILAGDMYEFEAALPLPRFAIRWLADDIALVTYRSETRTGGATAHANRVSVWKHGSLGWRLEFHQGTPVQP
jgi:hypothetical protein